MGKGKGKRQTWIFNAHAGLFLFEVKNLRIGRVLYFFKQLQARLPIPTKIIFSIYFKTKIYFFLKTKTKILPF